MENVEHLTHAAESGDTEAMYQLGLHALQSATGGTFAESLNSMRHWLKQAAESGHNKAATELALHYLAFEDRDKSRIWAQLAADRGDTIGTLLLARLVFEAEGPTPEVLRWYEIAAEAGNTDAMVNLGAILAKEDNAGAAIRWWTRAADLGDSNGMFNLGLICADIDQRLAIHWFEQAAAAGHADALAIVTRLGRSPAKKKSRWGR